MLLVLLAPACKNPNADSVDFSAAQLRELLLEAEKVGDHEKAYDLAMRLVEKEPEEAYGYLTAATALRQRMMDAGKEIDALLALANEQVDNDGFAKITKWAKENEPDFKISVPFRQDQGTLANRSGITSGNMVNGERSGGLLTTQGDWTYYASRGEEGGLRKTRIGSDETEKIADDDAACFLNISGDWLYYCNTDDGDRIYKVRTDGAERSMVSEDRAEYMSLLDGWLHYACLDEGAGLYRIRVDGTERTLLVDSPVKFPYAHDGWVYYSVKEDPLALCRVRTDGSDAGVIVNEPPVSYCISGDWLYFQAVAPQDVWPLIKRMRLDGSDASPLLEWFGKLYAFNVDGDHLYLSVNDLETREDATVVLDTWTLEEEQRFPLSTEMLCVTGTRFIYCTDREDGTWLRFDCDTCNIDRVR